MPRVFRQQYTAPIPENAQPATATDRRGRRVPGVRFRGLNNKAVIAPLTQDGTRCRLISDYWYGNVPDPEVPGGRRRVKLSTNKVAAEVMLAEKVRKAAQKGAGMTDPFEEQVKRPLEEHLAEWEEHLRTSTRGKRGRPPSDKHVQRTLARVRRVLDGCGFRFPRGISFASVQKFLLGLTNERRVVELDPTKQSFTRRELAALLSVTPAAIRSLVKRHRLAATGNGKARRYPRTTAVALVQLAQKGMGICTAGYYAREVKSFTAWLAKNVRIPKDPLVDLPGAAGDYFDLRRNRRALDEEELRRLLGAAEQSTSVFRGLSGNDRRHLYLAAMGTGFRAGELASLCPEHFDLAGDSPSVLLSAAVC